VLQARVIPCLLLKGEALIKTRKFDKRKHFDYIGDPVNAVKIFNDLEVDEIIFLDIFATLEDREPNFSLLKDIATECFVPMSYGGGVKSLPQFEKILRLGFEKVVLNAALETNQQLVIEASKQFGRQSVVASIDVKKRFLNGNQVWSYSRNQARSETPRAWASKLEELGAGEIFLNSVDRDGTMEGYDLALIEEISKQVSVPLTVCGGASNLADLAKAKALGASGLAAGSLFVFQGKNRSVLLNFPNREEINQALIA